MEAITRNSVGSRISELRKAAGFSQENLASKVNVSRQSVSNWENGIQEPSVEALLRLCSAMDVTVNEFFAGIEGPALSSADRQAALQAEVLAADAAVPEEISERVEASGDVDDVLPSSQPSGVSEERHLVTSSDSDAAVRENRKNKTIKAILITSISILAFGLVVVGLLFFPAVTYARYGDYTKLSLGTLNITHGMVIFLGLLFVLMLILEMILVVCLSVRKKRHKKSVLSSRPDIDVKQTCQNVKSA